MWLCLTLLILSFVPIVKTEATKLYTSSQYLLVGNQNFTLHDTRYNPLSIGSVSYTLSICYGNLSNCPTNPLSMPVLWIVPDLTDIPRTISVAQALRIPVLVFVSDTNVPYYYIEDTLTTLVFCMSPAAAATLSSVSGNTTATVVYTKNTNCELTYLPSVICGSVLFVFYMFWSVILLLWILSLTHWFEYQTVYLHTLLTALAVTRIIADSLFLILLGLCPWQYFSPEYIETLLTSIDTVYESLWFTIILLISFGYSTISNRLTNSQITMSFSVLTGTYLLYSSYYISEGTGLSHTILSITIGVYQVVMLLYYVRNLAENTAVASLQERVVQDEANLEEVRDSIHTKGKMYKWLIVLLTIYVSYRVVMYVVVPFYNLEDYTLLVLAALESVANLMVLTGLMIIFHPCFYTPEFQLTVFDVAADEQVEGEERPARAGYASIAINIPSLQQHVADENDARRNPLIVVNPVCGRHRPINERTIPRIKSCR